MRLIQDAFSLSAITDEDGNYRFLPVRPGDYLLIAKAAEHIDELYDNIPCASFNPGADRPNGTLLNFTANDATRTINLQLARSGVIRGRATRFESPNVPSSYQVDSLDGNGNTIARSFIGSDSSGVYALRDAFPGSFRLAFSASAVAPKIFPLVDCFSAENGNFAGCNLTGTQVLTVASGGLLQNIDCRLRGRGYRRARVLSEETSLPLSDIAIDAWQENLARVNTLVTDADGFAYVSIGFAADGVFYLSADNRRGLVNQVFDNRPCPNGSAYGGGCSLLGGALIALPAANNAPTIVIGLRRSDALLRNSFEP